MKYPIATLWMTVQATIAALLLAIATGLICEGLPQTIAIHKIITEIEGL